MRTSFRGFSVINFILLIAIIAVFSATIIPSLKKHSMRTNFRELVGAVDSLSSIVEKCLGFERNISSCATMEQLVPYGFSPSSIKVNSLIESITLQLENNQYHLGLTPNQTNKIHSFINDEHTYILVADIIDRNGRPIIEEWKVDPQSGCMIAGLC